MLLNVSFVFFSLIRLDDLDHLLHLLLRVAIIYLDADQIRAKYSMFDVDFLHFYEPQY